MRSWQLQWLNSDLYRSPRKRRQRSTQNRLGIGTFLSGDQTNLARRTFKHLGIISTRITLTISFGIVTGAYNCPCVSPCVKQLILLDRLSIEFPEVVATTKADVRCIHLVPRSTDLTRHSIGGLGDGGRDWVWSVSSVDRFARTHNGSTQGPETRYFLCWQ